MTDIELFYNIYNARNAHSFSFNEIEPLLNINTLQQVCNDKNFSTKKLARNIDFNFLERYSFWSKILQMRTLLPQKELLDLWYSIHTDRSCPTSHTIQIPLADGESTAPITDKGYKNEKIVGRYRHIIINNKPDEFDIQLLKKSPLTEELLIDHPAVINRYCQVQKAGYKTLRHIRNLRRSAKQKLPAQMRDAAANDNMDIFMIFKDMTGKKISYSLLIEIIKNKAFKIFSELLKNNQIFKQIPLNELAVYFTVQFEDTVSVEFLKIIEDIYPGSLRNVRDHWGRNLLWYALYNRKTAFFHPFCKLTEFLLANGCDPDNRNQLGLTWRFMIKNLDFEQKENLITKRYSYSPPLLKEQPFYALADKSYEAEWLKKL